MKRFTTKDWVRSGWLSASVLLGSIVLIISTLYWAREVLIPVALAVLLTFILTPVVARLRHWGLGRAPAVAITVILALAVIGAAGTMIFGELKSLADDLPAYRQNIRKKIADVRLLSKSGTLKKVQETVNDAVAEFHKEDAGSTNKAAVPVVVTSNQAPERSIADTIRPILSPLASTGLVIVLVIFMLLRREDLRDRLLRLAGYGRLTATTKAIDEAGLRVSRYLFRQCLINTAFGLAVGVGLYYIGLRYAILWGFLAGVARFIPYFGPWLGALCPTLVSLAVFNSWQGPLLVIGLVALLELITNLLVEPFVYGQGIGVSEVSLLIMMAFWTWLWGPIGLILATPLTVCLLVISKTVPDLEFIAVLLSNKPALAPHYAFYQRLIAHDEDEAREITRAFLKKHSRMELFEKVILPALFACRQDTDCGKLTSPDQAFLFQAIRQLLREIQTAALADGTALEAEKGAPVPEPLFVDRLLILGSPAEDEADELALLMLGQLLPAREAELRVLSSELFSAETFGEIEKSRPALVCIGMLSGGEIFPIRQFGKRLHARFPEMPIVVGCWGARKNETTQDQLAGLTDAVGWNMTESVNQLLQFGQASPAAQRVRSEQLRLKAGTLTAEAHAAFVEPQ